MRKVQLTPLFVGLVGQNPETNLLLQLATHVCVIVAPSPNKIIKLTKMFLELPKPRDHTSTQPYPIKFT
jgi:hypothetical protein